MTSLAGKSREEIERELADHPRADLLDLIFFLATLEPLLTPREIAQASHVSKRDVLQDMKAGKFIDPVLGAGFFCRGKNSLRVGTAAVNAWRRRFFVRVRSAAGASSNGSAKKSGGPADIVVGGKKSPANGEHSGG
jgi:hypothetical protein